MPSCPAGGGKRGGESRRGCGVEGGHWADTSHGLKGEEAGFKKSGRAKGRELVGGKWGATNPTDQRATAKRSLRRGASSTQKNIKDLSGNHWPPGRVGDRREKEAIALASPGGPADLWHAPGWAQGTVVGGRSAGTWGSRGRGQPMHAEGAHKSHGTFYGGNGQRARNIRGSSTRCQGERRVLG